MEILILKQNYRSTKMIVNASQSLIAKNRNKLEKQLFTENEEGIPVVYYNLADQEEENKKVYKLIELLNKHYGVPYNEIAILYRMSYMSRRIEETLLKMGVPYEVISGLPFYNRKEIKDIMSFVRIISNPLDFQALIRCINIPKRGIGEATINKIKVFAETNDINYIDACREINLTGKAGLGIKEFLSHYDKLSIDMDNLYPVELIDSIIQTINYQKYLEDTEKPKDVDTKKENLKELCNIASHFDTLDEFIQNIALNSSSDENEETRDSVKLLTMHASKGLEWKAVLIIEANEGINPHWKADSLASLEEERRLFYVAMTRAKEYLFITRPYLVAERGRCATKSESRFIDEINEEFIAKY